jgi:hypothetical protein
MPEDDILHSHRHENLKPCIVLTGWILWRRRNVSPVKYELGLYNPEEDILHCHSQEKLKSHTQWIILRINVRVIVRETFLHSFLYFHFMRANHCRRTLPSFPSVLGNIYLENRSPEVAYINYCIPWLGNWMDFIRTNILKSGNIYSVRKTSEWRCMGSCH